MTAKSRPAKRKAWVDPDPSRVSAPFGLAILIYRRAPATSTPATSATWPDGTAVPLDPWAYAVPDVDH